MKTLIPILIAVLVGVFNIPFVYGFKKAYSQNPFIFAASFNLCSAIFLLGVSFAYRGVEKDFFFRNWLFILSAACGIILINLSAYYIINSYGAGYWMIASLSNLLIPPILVGIFIFKEKFNYWIFPTIFCAILTVVLFTLSKK